MKRVKHFFNILFIIAFNRPQYLKAELQKLKQQKQIVTFYKLFRTKKIETMGVIEAV